MTELQHQGDPKWQIRERPRLLYWRVGRAPRTLSAGPSGMNIASTSRGWLAADSACRARRAARAWGLCADEFVATHGMSATRDRGRSRLPPRTPQKKRRRCGGRHRCAGLLPDSHDARSGSRPRPRSYQQAAPLQARRVAKGRPFTLHGTTEVTFKYGTAFPSGRCRTRSSMCLPCHAVGLPHRLLVDPWSRSSCSSGTPQAGLDCRMLRRLAGRVGRLLTAAMRRPLARAWKTGHVVASGRTGS